MSVDSSTRARRVEATLQVEPRRFIPKLTLDHQQGLVSLVRRVGGLPIKESVPIIRSVIDATEARQVHLTQRGVAPDDLQPTTYYLAALRLLRDLVLQGWTPGTDDQGVFFLPPTVTAPGEDPSDTKADLRESFQFALADQLLSDSVSRFIGRMERAGISRLFADGNDLARRLADLGPAASVTDALKPYLELVHSTDRDPVTGILLQDIWRYARLQWSIPYQPTPGRNLHYLIRDAAAPERPIIGITALGNAILGLSQRDDALGWSAAAVRRRMEMGGKAEQLRLSRHFLGTLRAERESVYSADFGIDGLTPGDAIARLREIERCADQSRISDLAEAGDKRSTEYNMIREVHDRSIRGHATDEDWLKVAQTNLYRRKRAASLAGTIRALATMEDLDLEARPENAWALLDGADGQRALETVLRRIKQRAIAENVMEIITCGAVAPYNQILGGKLVSMLMASPQVAIDIHERYSGRVSLIASSMAGHAVVRVPALAVLTTSSLYAVGSAQYNRIRIPGSIIEGGVGSIRYERIGTTDSYGTVQFSSDTAKALSNVARIANGKKRLVNNLFGEGISPKLRTLRMGLEGLGLQPDEYLRHHSPRLLYVVPLATNYADVLLGLCPKPQYVLPETDPAMATSAIAQNWYDRWGINRISRPDTIPRLAATSRDSILLSKVASDLSSAAFAEPGSDLARLTSPQVLNIQNSTGPISFVEKLYRNSHSYADRLTPEEMDSIHVDLGMEQFICEGASKGKQIIITGNPGDGKTFVIERLRHTLEGTYNAVVITDANAASDSQIVETWRSCDGSGRAFVLAVNEWPLFELQRLAQRQGFEPVEEAIRQVRSAVYYDKRPHNPRGRVTVIDLNLRNVLAPRVVQAALAKLLAPRFTSALDSADPAAVNASVLGQPRAQARLVQLLGQVHRQTGHVTMRHLLGYLAYIITGGTDSTQRIRSQGSGRYLYANLAFDREAQGPLFATARRVFDPSTITHPEWDERLWRGTTDPDDWLDPSIASVMPAQCPPEDQDQCFRLVKRRFFFEHEHGSDLLTLVPPDESEFDQMLKDGLRENEELVRRLVLAINRFYEPDVSPTGARELKLWQSHRFDVRPPTAFVSLYSTKSADMRVRAPQLADWVRAWLPEDLHDVKSFAIEAESDVIRPIRLVVDRDLFLTLTEAAAGLGRSTWSRSVARKVTRFIDGLHRQAHEPGAVVDLELRNVDTNLKIEVKVHRETGMWEL